MTLLASWATLFAFRSVFFLLLFLVATCLALSILSLLSFIGADVSLLAGRSSSGGLG